MKRIALNRHSKQGGVRLSHTKDREELAIRYLLGGLSEEERTILGERFFADDAEFEDLEIAEGELIDRYVRRELSVTDQRQFEKMLRTSPRLLKRVEFARIMARRVPLPAPQKTLSQFQAHQKKRR